MRYNWVCDRRRMYRCPTGLPLGVVYFSSDRMKCYRSTVLLQWNNLSKTRKTKKFSENFSVTQKLVRKSVQIFGIIKAFHQMRRQILLHLSNTVWTKLLKTDGAFTTFGTNKPCAAGVCSAYPWRRARPHFPVSASALFSLLFPRNMGHGPSSGMIH